MSKNKSGLLVIGAGYVGLVTGVCFAEMGNRVACVDIDGQRIEDLKKGIAPFFEPGLGKMLAKNIRKGNISFDEDIASAVSKSEIIFIAVGTPSRRNGSADLSFVKKAAEDLGKSINSYKIISIKSTVPPKTGEMVEKIIRKYYKGPIDIVSNPEFLREGSAIMDFMKPDRVVIGVSSRKAKEGMKKLYEELNTKIIFTDFESSEMIKYSSNAFLATKISFINEIANLCESIGANVEDVAAGMGLDQRIGKDFLKAGLGYGGSCFPKDVRSLCYTAKTSGDNFHILESVMEVNDNQYRRIIKKAEEVLMGDLAGKTIGVWGLSFKANTDDVRESAAVEIIKNLHKKGAFVKAYDPIATKNAQRALSREKTIFYDDLYKVIDGCDALLITTDWEGFRLANFQKMKRLLKNPVVIDGRNIYNPKKMKAAGFLYKSVGR